MKTLFIAAMAAGLVLSQAGAQAKSMTGAQAKAQIMELQGTWTCKGDAGTHTATFTPLYGGKAMQIQEADSMETITFDVKRQKWIDQHIDGQGMYGTMEGAPVEKGIDFTLVYPQTKATGKIRMVSKTVQTSDFTMVQNGKTMHQKETCTKNP